MEGLLWQYACIPIRVGKAYTGFSLGFKVIKFLNFIFCKALSCVYGRADSTLEIQLWH